MVDFKEALETLQYEVYEEGHCSYIAAELGVAMAALEKQIPMNPSAKLHGRHYDFYCPVCGKQQKKNYTGKRVNEGWYCEKCGQKLRWRADND